MLGLILAPYSRLARAWQPKLIHLTSGLLNYYFLGGFLPAFDGGGNPSCWKDYGSPGFAHGVDLNQYELDESHS